MKNIYKPLIGIGLREEHHEAILLEKPSIGWLEVHSEGYFQTGPKLQVLQTLRSDYPISLHGVGLSLGSAEGVCERHLKALKNLIGSVEAFLISDHLSWSRINGMAVPDLLPIPYNHECAEILKENVSKTQDFLQREILLENPSSYLEYTNSDFSEVDFLVTLCNSTGAKILLDINNVFVSCCNHGWNTLQYINSIPPHLVAEIHLAGHTIEQIGEGDILRADTHDQIVCDEVWHLYEYAIKRFKPLPTLLEWDANLPDLFFLIEEAHKALNFIHTGLADAAA